MRGRQVIISFLAIAFGTAWLIWLPLLLGPAGLRFTSYDVSLPFFVSLGTVGPFAAGFIATRLEGGRWRFPSRLLPGRDAGRWMNLLSAPALMIIAFVVVPYAICVKPGSGWPAPAFLLPLLGVWPNILGGPLEEEFGWRGYLLPRLSERVGRLQATLLTGLIWACWHLPLIVCGIYAGLSFAFYLPLVIAVSAFASFAYFSTGGSILGGVVLHYVFNTCSSMQAKSFEGRAYRADLDWGRVDLACLTAAALMIVLMSRGSFTRDPMTMTRG